jgi:nucleotide-binding universal stress UspA family protein
VQGLRGRGAREPTIAPGGSGRTHGKPFAPPPSGGDPMTPFRHILAPVDFERCSQLALDAAVDLAIHFDARLTVFHAWDIPALAYSGMVVESPETWATLAEAAQQAIDAALLSVRARVPAAQPLLTRGPPAAEILAAIERTKADLVVIGTHGRQGFGRFFLGSVAEKVVRASPVPVLTFRGAVGKP